MTYKLNALGGVTRESDGACIPEDPDNRDWQEYAQWLALGNQPTPADLPDWRTPVMETYRQNRETYLSRLAGIAVFEGAGDGTIRQAASTFRQRLLDIPQAASVTAATSEQELKLAILALYKAAVAEAKATAAAAAAAFDKVSK